MAPQPLSRQERIKALFEQLEEGRQLLEDHELQASLQWIDNFEAQLKPFTKLVQDNHRHANRRTCPKTNEKNRRRQPLPRNVIGSMTFDKENCLPPSGI
jgi:hypothetical protein